MTSNDTHLSDADLATVRAALPPGCRVTTRLDYWSGNLAVVATLDRAAGGLRERVRVRRSWWPYGRRDWPQYEGYLTEPEAVAIQSGRVAVVAAHLARALARRLDRPLPDAPGCDWRPAETVPEDFYAI